MEEPKISTNSITEKGSSYKRWIASEGIPIIEGFFIKDIREVPLEPWKRTGGLATRICLEAPVKPMTPIFAKFLPVRPLSHRNICSKS